MKADTEREHLQAMFDEMRNKAGWNLEGEMLWSYFFTDPSEAKLQAAAQLLAKQGYEVVGVDEAEFDEEHVHDEHCAHGAEHAAEQAQAQSAVTKPAPSAHVHDENCAHGDEDEDEAADNEVFFVLQVDETKRHTVDSLHARHIELRAFASRHAIDAFDGIEVGEVAKLDA